MSKQGNKLAAKYAKQIADCKKKWTKVAIGAGWYNDRVAAAGGFWVHVWVDSKGHVIDSVYQTPGIQRDTIQIGRKVIL